MKLKKVKINYGFVGNVLSLVGVGITALASFAQNKASSIETAEAITKQVNEAVTKALSERV